MQHQELLLTFDRAAYASAHLATARDPDGYFVTRFKDLNGRQRAMRREYEAAHAKAAS